MVLTTAIWIALLVLYILKWLVAPEMAKKEASDPVQACYVGLVGVATMLVGAALQHYSGVLSATLFGIGAVGAAVAAFWRTGVLYHGGRNPSDTTPALYLPFVTGSFVLSVGLSSFGLLDYGQLAFGAGLFSWLAIESVLLHRLYTASEMSETQRPTLGISLAPPAVAALAYVEVSPSMGDVVAHAFIGYALLQALLLVRLLPWIVHRFSPSLWAFSFGAAALSQVSELLTIRGDIGAITVIAFPAFIFANVVIIGLLLGTLLLLVKGQLMPS